MSNVYLFIGSHFLQFILTSFMTFHHKEFFKFVPFPSFLSFLNGIFILPISFFVSWSSHKFSNNFGYLKIPLSILKWFIYSTLLTTIGIIVMNISIFASDIDFVLLFRLTSVVWNGLFGYLFLNEQLSYLGFLSLGIVLIGIFFITKDFEWSTSKMPSTTQIFLQLFSMLIFSINLLCNKKVLNIISHNESNFKIMDFLFWKTILLLPISFFASLILDPGAWINFLNIFDTKTISWILLTTFLHQITQMVTTYVEKITSMITIAVIDQLRILGTLVISNFTYHQTNWKFSKLIGAGLLFCGGILYSLSRMQDGFPKDNHVTGSNSSKIEEEIIVINPDLEPDLEIDISKEKSSDTDM